MILVTTPGSIRTRAARLLAHDSGRPVAEIAALGDAGEPRLDISERGLLTDTAAFPERAEASELRRRVCLFPEG